MTEPTTIANSAYEQFLAEIKPLAVSDRILAVEELVTCLDVCRDELWDEQNAGISR